MNEQVQENRLRKFAGFFKSYMGVMPLVTAAVAPILTLSKAIPVFESEKTTLATYSGLLGFLMVAWVFYARSGFVPAMIPHHRKINFESPDDEREEQLRREWAHKAQRKANVQPLGLILLSLLSYMSYTWMMDHVLNLFLGSAVGGKPLTRSVVLATAGVDFSIPYHAVLQILYLGIFLCAEAAFVLMALREYAYGVLKISEIDVLGGPEITAARPPLHLSAPSRDGAQDSVSPLPTSLRHSRRDAS